MFPFTNHSSEYGGTLPPLPHPGLNESLRSHDSIPQSTSSSQVTSPASNGLEPAHRIYSSISATSLLNPFFGYPASVSPSSHVPRHGRRRKRDLVRTLARLWWARWRTKVNSFAWVIGLLVGIWLWRRRLAWMRRNGELFAWNGFTSGFPW